MNSTSKIVLLLLSLIGSVRCATAESVNTKQLQLDPEIQAILNYHALDNRENLCKVQDRVHNAYGNGQETQRLQVQLIQVLQFADATPDAKEFVCRQLALMGDKRAVPALASLLNDERFSHMARYALERIPDPSSAKALRGSLKHVMSFEKVGVINSLGELRDSRAERLLKRCLDDPDPLIAGAAAAALGKIGDKFAARTLAAARSNADPSRRRVLTDACLLACRRLPFENKANQAFVVCQEIYRDTSEPRGKRLAALTEMISVRPSACASLVIPILEGRDEATKTFVLRFVREDTDTPSAKQFASLLPRLATGDEVLVIGVLALQQNPITRDIARGAILVAAQSSDRDVQIAALNALRYLGQAADIPILLSAAKSPDPDKQHAAREALDKLPGQAIDDALTARLADEDGGTRTEIVRTLTARRPGRQKQH
jgi:HEAT repeat protein